MDTLDRKLLNLLQHGLSVTPRPYLVLAEKLGITETEVLTRLARLKQQSVIKRFGVIVKHRQLGYQANAMVVWDIPDRLIDDIGSNISQAAFVNLCYQRPRRENWRYNLFCMIHGKDRATVLTQLQSLIETHALQNFDYQVLFSRRCFKQRGALYRS
jgi:siroheme decarboxylase